MNVIPIGRHLTVEYVALHTFINLKVPGGLSFPERIYTKPRFFVGPVFGKRPRTMAGWRQMAV